MKHTIILFIILYNLKISAQNNLIADGSEQNEFAYSITGRWSLDSATTEYQLFYERSTNRINELMLNITDSNIFELDYYFFPPERYCHYSPPDLLMAEYKISGDTFKVIDKHYEVYYPFLADFKIEMPDSNHLVLTRLKLNRETYPSFYKGYFKNNFSDLTIEQQSNMNANDGADFTWEKETDSSFIVYLWGDTAFEIINSPTQKSTLINQLYKGDHFEYQTDELMLADEFEKQSDFMIDLPATIYIWKWGAIFKCRFKNQSPQNDDSFYLVFNLTMY